MYYFFCSGKGGPEKHGEVCFYDPYCRGYINNEEENRIHFKDGNMVFQLMYDKKHLTEEHANDFMALVKSIGDGLFEGRAPEYTLDQ